MIKEDAQRSVHRTAGKSSNEKKLALRPPLDGIVGRHIHCRRNQLFYILQILSPLGKSFRGGYESIVLMNRIGSTISNPPELFLTILL
jgi:hypothetical protein